MHDAKTETIARLIRTRAGNGIGRVLVVGCGSGAEAAVLQTALAARVTGIDINSRFLDALPPGLDLRVGDAQDLQFDSGSFDLVYSYHVLEHVSDYSRALAEMQRVLSDGGFFCIGTPNRSRLIGYMGSKDASLTDKILWNWLDWLARMRGRFRNEFGAHAGFTKMELQSALAAAFGSAEDVSLEYYVNLYSRHRLLIRLIAAIGASRWIFPALYFVGRKVRPAV